MRLPILATDPFHTADPLLAADPVLAADVDWNDVHAVRLLGMALGALLLVWAVRRLFGGGRR